jgi:EAL domain-containing protein (putative c-di-GMP-specific phosphodiesterase class I)
MLLENADVAMYHAKTSGRAGYRFFDRAMSHSATAKIELDGALRRAVREHEFTLHYQPQISLSSGAVIGVEALLRWQSPAGDMMAPSEFLPLAEEIGLTIPIGEWVLRTARDEVRWLRTRAGRPIKLSINLTRRQFLHENLINTLRSIVDTDARKTTDLELEISGSVLLSDADAARRQIGSIAGLGIGIAIDDFGSGYSSLAEIARLPIATFKLGRSLIGNISKPVGDDAVLDAVIALAKNLRIGVCAQGVETAQQLALLRARRCDLGQGLYLGKPEPIDCVGLEDFDFNAPSPTGARAVGAT